MSEEREPVGTLKPIVISADGSIKKKEPVKKDVQQIAKGIAKKKSPFKKFLDILVLSDAKTIKDWIINDKLVPWVKDSLLDFGAMLFYGDTRRGSGVSSSYKTNYQAYTYKYQAKPTTAAQKDEKYDFNEIILATKGEAESVLMGMARLIDQYGSASITDLYSLVGVTGNDFQEAKWGWDKTNWGQATSKRIREGYLLVLPDPFYFKD